MSSQSIVTDFRILMRHMKALPSFKEKASPLRIHVLNKIKEGKLVKDQSEAAELRALLHSYATMARDIKESKYLRYLDSGDKLDPREKIKNTAARVGLAVPKFSDEFEKEIAKPKYA